MSLIFVILHKRAMLSDAVHKNPRELGWFQADLGLKPDTVFRTGRYV